MEEYVESIMLPLKQYYQKRKSTFEKIMAKKEQTITEIMKSYHDGAEKKVMALLADTRGLRQLRCINNSSVENIETSHDLIETLSISPDIIYNFVKNPV